MLLGSVLIPVTIKMLGEHDLELAIIGIIFVVVELFSLGLFFLTVGNTFNAKTKGEIKISPIRWNCSGFCRIIFTNMDNWYRFGKSIYHIHLDNHWIYFLDCRPIFRPQTPTR